MSDWTLTFSSYLNVWTQISNIDCDFSVSGEECFLWTLVQCECVIWSLTASDDWPLPPLPWPHPPPAQTPHPAVTQCGSTTAETTLAGGSTLRWGQRSEVRPTVQARLSCWSTVPLYFHRRVCFCLFCSDDDCAAVKERTRILLDSVLLSSAACGEAHRGGQFPWSEGGALYYTPEPVYPQHQGGLPAECHLWIQTADPKTAHVSVLGDADASSSVSSTVVLQKRHSLWHHHQMKLKNNDKLTTVQFLMNFNIYILHFFFLSLFCPVLFVTNTNDVIIMIILLWLYYYDYNLQTFFWWIVSSVCGTACLSVCPFVSWSRATDRVWRRCRAAYYL